MPARSFSGHAWPTEETPGLVTKVRSLMVQRASDVYKELLYVSGINATKLQFFSSTPPAAAAHDSTQLEPCLSIPTDLPLAEKVPTQDTCLCCFWKIAKGITVSRHPFLEKASEKKGYTKASLHCLHVAYRSNPEP